LLIVGGNGSTPRRFARAWPFLRERFDPVLVELAGQGGRARAAIPDRFDGFVADLENELRRAAGEGGGLCYGHGIGGLLLAHAVRRSPSLASRLILDAPVGAHLVRRRLVSWVAWPPLAALGRAVLGSPLLGPVVTRRLFEPEGAVSRSDRLDFAAGYRQARSFGRLFSVIDPLEVLDGLRSLSVPVTLLWGERDSVLPCRHLAAWAEALAAAPVTARLVPAWRHYPYMDRPQEFAEVLAECDRAAVLDVPVSLDHLTVFSPRSKAGRLATMRRAGLPVPPGWWIPPAALENGSAARLFATLPRAARYAVRSSAAREDQVDRIAAGVYESELDVSPDELPAACQRVSRSARPDYFEAVGERASALAPCDVLVQAMAPRTAGGVA
jgi:pimeloyl-ACP methyl ester carboxylesterase